MKDLHLKLGSLASKNSDLKTIHTIGENRFFGYRKFGAIGQITNFCGRLIAQNILLYDAIDLRKPAKIEKWWGYAPNT